MNTNYIEAKNYIEKLRSEYCCKGDLIFRCAVQNIVEYGVVPLTQNLAVEDWLSDIDRRHDEAEAEGKILYISRDFEKAMAECTFKLAKVGSMNLMMYIQREVWHSDNCNEISYERAIKILKNILVNKTDCDLSYEEQLEEFYDVGLDDGELVALGFGYLFEEEE